MKAVASLLSRRGGNGMRPVIGAFRSYLQPSSCSSLFRCLSSIVGLQPLSHCKSIGALSELGNLSSTVCNESIVQRRHKFLGSGDGDGGGTPSKGHEECKSLRSFAIDDQGVMEVIHHHSAFLLPSTPADHRPSLSYAVIILNQRLPRFTPLLWQHAELRLCADGGANRLFDEMPDLFPHEEAAVVRNRYKPDVIKGDMDSIRTEVLDYYVKLGTKVVDESNDQDTTDLHKCVSFILDFTPYLDKSKLCILVAGALGGRFDHEVGNINVLCLFKDTRIILISDDCLIHLLPKAQNHEIHILSSVVGPHCGLIPIGMPSKSTTTTGLQWDLNETEMKFGGLISTSNIASRETVTVRSDSDLLWTISIKKP